MNRGKDFWEPRRHGFDDDGPMPYEPRQRQSRPHGGSDIPFDESNGGGAPLANQPTVEATVKWFKDEKGFGFVELANGQGDAFLHATVLHAAGHDSVAAGAKMRVIVGAGAKGPQVAQVISIDASSAFERPRRPFSDAPRAPRRTTPDPSTATPLEGKVKWFNETKGFGFVAVEDGGKDIFVHVSALNAAGIAHLNEGQSVNMRVVDTPRGREAISISV
ncbi:MAG: cold shock domain-containing protein [Hyphomicrobiales bacterium]|nr:cold shock domain-containing protein [Hyphomicrobiales bacterium]MBV8439891.1 cold shock domain-containing protein [Hyphomicrobiales bacterium]